MVYYLILGFLITLIGAIGYFAKSNKIAIITILAIIILFAGLRGDFTIDYRHYKWWFHKIKHYNFVGILTNDFDLEKGFVLLTKFISYITKSEIVFFLILAAISIICYYQGVKKTSEFPLLTLLLFVGIGGYYESFNITRHFLAVSIVFMGMDCVYKGRFLQYLIYVLIASFFHRIALFMIPMYFLLRMKVNVSNLFFTLVVMLLIGLSLPSIVGFVRQIYPRFDYDYGTSEGLTIGSIFVPSMLLLFTIISPSFVSHNNFDYNNSKNCVLINSLIWYVIFAILSTKILMLSRFVGFFRPLALVLITNLLKNIADRKTKIIVVCVVCILAMIFPYITLMGTGYDPFYFFWQ